MNARTIIASTVALVLALGCSKEGSNSPKNGQYLYEDSSVTISLTPGEAITIFINGKYEYQNVYSFGVIGEWPNYTYTTIFKNSFNGIYQGKLVMDVVYANAKSFTATIVDTDIEDLPTTMVFTYNEKALDKNHDGILDSWQDL